MKSRIVAAWDAFRGTPPDRYLLVEPTLPFGWRVMHRFDTYHEAFDYKLEHQANPANLRVMVESEWIRRTIELMLTQDPWAMLGRLVGQRDALQRDVDDLRAIQKANVLDAFVRAKHPQ